MSETVTAITWVVLVMLANGLMTRPNHGWADTLRVSALRPPRGAFAPGWALILSFAATGGVLGWDHAPDASTRAWLVGLFVLNSLLNISWSALYFLLRRPDWALIEILLVWLSILALILFIASFSVTASFFLLPYLAWVSFASFLNLRVVQLNGPFNAQSRVFNA